MAAPPSSTALFEDSAPAIFANGVRAVARMTVCDISSFPWVGGPWAPGAYFIEILVGRGGPTEHHPGWGLPAGVGSSAAMAPQPTHHDIHASRLAHRAGGGHRQAARPRRSGTACDRTLR